MNRPLALVSLLLAAQNLPCLAANPPTGANASYTQAQAARRYMPKWVYYDRLGLAAWNKGERPTAKTHWEYAMSLCENDLRGRPKGRLDKQTKIWVNDLLTHMTFLMSYYNQPTAQSMRNLSAKDAMIKLKEAVVEDIDKKLQWFDKLESFAKMLVGRECYIVQDFRMLRAKQLMMQEQYRREIANLKGVPYVQKNDGDGYNYVIQDGRAVKKPAWWKQGAEVPTWRRDYLKVGSNGQQSSSSSSTTRGKATTGTTGVGTMGRPSWWDKGDKPEIPGVSYVGGKQVKNDKVGADGTVWNPAKGDSSTLWGQDPHTENSKPNKWGTQAERNPALDLNAKQKPPNWGENNTPRETSTTGWGNGGQASDQPKNQNGVGEVNPNSQGGDYWK